MDLDGFLMSPWFWGVIILAFILMNAWAIYRYYAKYGEYHPVKPVPSPYKSKKSGFGPIQDSPERLLAEAMA